MATLANIILSSAVNTAEKTSEKEMKMMLNPNEYIGPFPAASGAFCALYPYANSTEAQIKKNTE